MPKKKSNRAVAAEVPADVPDNVSVTSLASDGLDSLSCLEADDQASIFTVTEKLCGEVEKMIEKRLETRVRALKAINNYLRNAYLGLDNMSWDHSETYLNGVEFILKKGRLQDRALAAESLSLMCGQYDQEEVPLWLERFKQPLNIVFRDSAEPCVIRGKCALALVSLCFFANCDNIPFIVQCMETFEAVFRGSSIKGDGKACNLASEVVELHMNAMQAWTLLLTMLPLRDVEKAYTKTMPVLINILKGSNVNMKIAAGESIAVFYERIRSEKDDSFRGIHYKELSAIFFELITDCDKSHSKEDRKKQRQSFREIMCSVVQDESSETNIRFGNESMQLISCIYHFYYEFLCDIMGAGINHHLRYNYNLRDLFDLGPPKPSDAGLPIKSGDRKSSKSKRNYENQCAFKLRTQALNCRRQKRSDALTSAEDF